MVKRHSAADCLREPLVWSLPVECRQLKKGFGNCKRGMIDMRKRFRGNQPVPLKAIQAADRGEGYQLYAGKSAFQSVRPTDGNEEQSDWREAENENYREQQAKEQMRNPPKRDGNNTKT